MRHLGSYSGLSTCRPASSRTVAAAPATATHAAASCVAVIRFAISLSSMYFMTVLLSAGTSAVPRVRYVGAGGPLRTSIEEESPIIREASGLGVQVALTGEVGRPPGGCQEGIARSRAIAGHLQQVRPDRVEPVVLGDPFVCLERVEKVQPRTWASGHGHCDGVVQRHNGIGGDPHQQLVQAHDLWPVSRLRAGRLVVDRRDRRLELVGAGWSLWKGVGDERH